MSNLKLVVEVVSAHNLVSKDGQGSSSSYVELHFDNQIFQTTIKEKDLDPAWNETFYFNISDPNNLSDLTLHAYVYNNVQANHSKSCLGKVSMNGTSFVPYSDAVILHYPLEKKGLFSRVRGELGLKVFFTDNPSIRSSNPSMSNLKLVVEVVSAHNLVSKDGQGSSSSYVELHFDNQIFRTTIKEKDLDPAWNETFYFNISDPNNLSDLTLHAYVYNNVQANHSKSCLGKVSMNGTSFVPYSDAVILHYPLEKKGLFSRVRGELGLKVFFTDNPSIRSSNPLPAMESSMYTNSYPNSYPTQAQAPPQQLPNFVPSAPPAPLDVLSEGPIHYPSIDFSPVDLSIPNVEDEEASRTNEAIDGDGSSSCVICWEAPVQGACIPCGHMAGCMSCLNEIKMKKGDCPVCRAKINEVIRLYAV